MLKVQPHNILSSLAGQQAISYCAYLSRTTTPNIVPKGLTTHELRPLPIEKHESTRARAEGGREFTAHRYANKKPHRNETNIIEEKHI